jgi:hypothetical protein
MSAVTRGTLQTWLPFIVLFVLVMLVGLYDNTFF